MRTASRLCLLPCLCACAGPTGVVPEVPLPDVPVVHRLAAGTVVVADTEGAPDDLPWRVVGTLWFEALRQSTPFAVLPAAPPHAAATAVRLSIEPQTGRLAACLVSPQGELLPLGGERAEPGQLGAAIDRLAATARAALGEAIAPPVPVTASLGGDAAFVDAVADARSLLRDGAIEPAFALLTRLRARDGGSPWLLEALAEAELLRGRPADAERIALEALRYEARLPPHRQHALARTLLLARSSSRPQTAPERDRELLELGRVFARERPHDPEGLLTLGLANNFLGRFEAAEASLRRLDQLSSSHAIATYHLGWAQLGRGDAAGAAESFARAAARLPATSTVVPRAIALHGAGRQAELQDLLAELAADLQERSSPQLHDLRRMQAAEALLRGDDDAARAVLTEDLLWLVRNPAALDARVGEFAETGIVLVRLGAAAALPASLAALQQQRPGSALADAIAFLSGLVTVDQTGLRAEAVERRLSQGGDSVFSLLLSAHAHERRGELGDQFDALSRAARMSDSPLVKHLLARSLVAMGRTDQAAQLRAALRREMLRIDLRQRARHPLLGPEYAYAFR